MALIEPSQYIDCLSYQPSEEMGKKRTLALGLFRQHLAQTTRQKLPHCNSDVLTGITIAANECAGHPSS